MMRGRMHQRKQFHSPGEEIPVRDETTGLFPPLNLPVRHYEIDGRPYVLLTPERLVMKKDLLVPREDDVLVATYPRNGTGFTLNLCMEIHKIHNPDLPADHPFFTPLLRNRTPWVHNKFTEEEVDISGMASPRVLKTHNYYPHLNIEPGSLRIIHVMRNPKDVVCSHFYHMTSTHKRLFEYEGNFQETVEYFLDGGFETGCYWQFNREFMENKDGHNILRLYYEELTSKREDGVRKINAFLGYEKLSDEQVEAVVKATTLDYENLRKNQVGKPGKAMTMMNKEQRERFDERCRKEFGGFEGIPESFFSEDGYVEQQ